MKKEIIFILISLILIPTMLAVECPSGEINDPYPGNCGIYTDQNSDRLCDYSQTQEQLNPAIKSQDNLNEKVKSRYNFLILSIISIILYLSSSILSRKGKIYSPMIHKKIWNLLLLISFLCVAISGLLFVLKIEYGLDISWFANMLFWHVETGIIMTIISIFHIVWHWNYFLTYIKKR